MFNQTPVFLVEYRRLLFYIDMEILLKRIAKKEKYTIGRFYIDGQYVCDTIEDKDRGLTQTTPLDEIKRIKVPSETAIPTGKYTVTIKVRSPKFSKKEYYLKQCNGYLPRILNVPGFDGILMHRGTDEKSSAGCIILGYNKIVGKVVESQKAYELVYNKLKIASNNGEKITITIQ